MDANSEVSYGRVCWIAKTYFEIYYPSIYANIALLIYLFCPGMLCYWIFWYGMVLHVMVKD